MRKFTESFLSWRHGGASHGDVCESRCSNPYSEVCPIGVNVSMGVICLGCSQPKEGTGPGATCRMSVDRRWIFMALAWHPFVTAAANVSLKRVYECQRSIAKVNVCVCTRERAQWTLTGHACSLLTSRRAAAALSARRATAAAVMNSRL